MSCRRIDGDPNSVLLMLFFNLRALSLSHTHIPIHTVIHIQSLLIYCCAIVDEQNGVMMIVSSASSSSSAPPAAVILLGLLYIASSSSSSFMKLWDSQPPSHRLQLGQFLWIILVRLFPVTGAEKGMKWLADYLSHTWTPLNDRMIEWMNEFISSKLPCVLSGQYLSFSITKSLSVWWLSVSFVRVYISIRIELCYHIIPRINDKWIGCDGH